MNQPSNCSDPIPRYRMLQSPISNVAIPRNARDQLVTSIEAFPHLGSRNSPIPPVDIRAVVENDVSLVRIEAGASRIKVVPFPLFGTGAWIISLVVDVLHY